MANQVNKNELKNKENEENQVSQNEVNQVSQNEENKIEEVAEDLGVKLFIKRVQAKDRLGKLLTTKKGEPIFNYVLPVVLRGKSIDIDFITLDRGGFEPLDLVYFGESEAELVVINYIQEIGGKKERKVRYEVQNIGDDGMVYKCSIKPSRRSDNDLLEMYLNVLKARTQMQQRG